MNHNVLITLSDGTVLRHSNLVVATGLAYMTARWLSNGTAVMGYMAVGTGTTANTGSLTALTTEIARVALTTATTVTTNVTNDTAEFVGQFGAGVGTGTIGEIGVFNASSGGIMLARILTTFVKDSRMVANITWKVTI